MAHNINSMMYYGEKPWHQLGREVSAVATSAEAIKAAGMDWKVFKRPLVTNMPGNPIIPVPDKFAIVREDSSAVLGVVGDVYRPLQNADAFKFFDAIVGEKAAMYHTAGALGEGERIWMLAKLPGYIRTTAEDVTEKYLLLTNSHDGTSAVTVMFTPIRVVCQNTLNIALSAGEGTTRAKLRHCLTLGTRVEEVRKQLGIMSGLFDQFEELSKALVSRPVNNAEFGELVKSSGLVQPEEDGKLSSRAYNIMEEVSRMFDRGRGNDLPGVRHTAWGAFNAISEYVDYNRTTKGAASNRTASLLFGSGAKVKQAAWDNSLALLRK